MMKLTPYLISHIRINSTYMTSTLKKEEEEEEEQEEKREKKDPKHNRTLEKDINICL